jgi:O-antigen ligase
MIRKYVMLLFALSALIGSLVAVFATQTERDFMLRGYADATQDQNLPHRMPLLGVNAELTQYTPDELRYHLNLMQEAHIYWVRQLVRWDNIETSQGVYDWATWDAILDVFAEFPQLELVAVIVDAPQWATSRPFDPTSQRTAPPDDPQTYADFIGAFAERYGGMVDYYQVWDEPNITLGWGNLPPNAIHYVAMLQMAYQAIHAKDPSAQVISAGLAPTIEVGYDNYNEFDFMRDLYANGAQDYADAWAGMPYGFEHSPQDRVVDANHLNLSRFVMLREIMTEYGDADKPLWASAWGWNALPADWSGNQSIWRDVSQQDQIAYTLNALARAEREWTWLGGMILYHWQPDTPFDDPRWGFSVMGQDDQPTPFYEALKNRPISEFATDGAYPAQNPFATYSGAWTFTGLGADIGWVQDSALEFVFEGRDIAIITREAESIAHFYVTIDNLPANGLPQDMAGNSYLTLRSATLDPTITIHSLATGLADGKHTLRLMADELVPDELTQRYPLVGFAVGSGDLRAPYDRQIAFGWISAILSFIAVIATVRAVNIGWIWQFIRVAWLRLNDMTQLIIGAGASVALLLAMFLAWNSGIPAIFKRDSVQLGLSIVTAGVIYLNPNLILTVIAILALFILIYHRLELGVLLTVFWSPFFLFPVELYRFSFPVAEVILLITASALVLRGFVQFAEDAQTLPKGMRGWAWHKNLTLLDMMMILWLILGVFGVLIATYRSPAITDFRTMFVEPFLLYVAIRVMSHDKKSLIRLMDALVLAGVAVSVIGLVMWIGGQSIITAEDGVSRLASVYGSPNNVGLILGRCIPFALAWILINPDKTRRWVGIGAFLVMSIAVVLTQSAGALFIGVPVGIITVITLSLRKKAIIPLIGVLIVVIAGAVIASQSPRFERLVDMTSGTNFYRLRAWQSAINIIQDKPITGIGLDQYLYYFRDGYMLPDAWQEPNLSHPHNIIFDSWLRLGIFGVIWLLAFVWIWAKTAWRGYKTHFEAQNRLILALIIGVMGSMTNLLAHGLVDNSLYVVDLIIVFMVLVGITSALPPQKSSSLPSIEG